MGLSGLASRCLRLCGVWKGGFWDAVVAARGFDGVEFPAMNPAANGLDGDIPALRSLGDIEQTFTHLAYP